MTRYTIATAAALALILHLGGCDKAQTSAQPQAASTEATAPKPLPSVATPPPTPSPPISTAVPQPVTKVAGKLPGPTDRDPTHALAYWRAAMEGRDWAAARSVFGEFGAQSGQSASAFAAAWDKYRILDVTVGTGEQDGAAGSSFYEVPVTITGLTRANKARHLDGR
jgi:hypothetical protein